MPTIKFRDGETDGVTDREIQCDENANLRHALLAAQASPYNGFSAQLNCRGLGTCGTCAVKVTGPVSKMTKIERARLSFPPHKADAGLRLACQCQVQGDIEITKRSGFWGHHPDKSK